MRLHLIAPAAIVIIASLTACSAPAADISELTLAQSKSPVQLLRNVAAERVSDAAPATTAQTKDVSVACRDASDDPKGLLRQWQSTVSLDVRSGSLETARDVAASFAAEDWKVRSYADDDASYRVVLSKPSSSASIHIEAGVTHVEIWVNGPCVATDGTTSDEVKNLESAD